MDLSQPDVYLDSNATTRVLPQAAHAAFEAMEDLFGNPSSTHSTGLKARYILETTRNRIRDALHADAGKIIFTSGATEAIQLAVFSVLSQLSEQQPATPKETGPTYLLYGATEHKAVPQALEHWNHVLKTGCVVKAIPVDSHGILNLDFLEKHVGQAKIVCTMAVNNETGVIAPLKEIEGVIRAHNESVPWLVDTVQAIGKLELDLASTTIDYAVFSGHKIHAPKGIGFLYARADASIVPLLAGGGQESGARGGTEYLPGVAALGAVFQCLNDEESSDFQSSETLAEFRRQLTEALEEAFPSIVYNGPLENSVSTTINFSVPGFSSKEILDLFDAAGVRVSSGSACGSAIRGSFVLEAMGLEPWRSDSAIRMSFSTCNTAAEITTACQRIIESGKALCDSCLAISNSVGASRKHPVDGLVQLKHENQCSWILLDQSSQTCVIIDPIEALADRIELLVRCQSCRVVGVLNTHTHPDQAHCHAMLTQLVSDLIDQPRGDCDSSGWPSFPLGQALLDDGSQAPFIQLHPGRIIAKIDTPGHTADSVAFLIGSMSQGDRLRAEDIHFAMTGDHIQIGGLGRSDKGTGDPTDFFKSSLRLAAIIDRKTVICPAHDYGNGFCTTLAAETESGGLLAQVLEGHEDAGSFATVKRDMDAQIENSSPLEWRCGLIQNPGGHHFVDIPAKDLPDFFREHQDAMIIDVREPHEHHLTHDWQNLGLAMTPENVPLTRFTDFINRQLRQAPTESQNQIICVCRSGNRSGKAAEVLNRLGVAQVWHVAGGLALGTPATSTQPDIQEIEYLI
ncbi:MAG: aminotransferase class V-fold PLP-dependent enzyme [Planctomycetota bacterium]|nr:aminotransferase class V-fold PLP-dependent enzyme [Planctomycetota bacterium]